MQYEMHTGLTQPEEVMELLINVLMCLSSCRVAFHWDNIYEAQQLVIRPAAPGWPWSGAFNLPDREAYFGLRLRNR